jgi:general secretion pathway protein L
VLTVTPSNFHLAPASGATAVLEWATSGNGLQVLDHGQCAASLLPRDEDVVLVLPPRALSWHRVPVPKVASARLRAVLDGLLEEQVLSDTAALHYALAPGGRAGQTVWVAACDKAWLRSWLHALEAAGRPVSRVVPALWPLPPAEGADGQAPALHWAYDEGNQAWLASASEHGVACIPLPEDAHNTSADTTTGGAAQRHHAGPADAVPEGQRWLADPSVAALAERLLNQPFELAPRPAWLLRCTQSDWNLAQFDLSLSSGARRTQRLRQTLRRWRTAPAWRPARWGLAALLVVQLLGLNAAAWNERRALADKQDAVRQTLQQSFPDVRVVLDAPLQMQRELQRLQQASGTLTTTDLEQQLGALAQAAAPDQPMPTSLVYASGAARLGGFSANEAQWQTLQQSLTRQGWRARLDGAELSLQPAPRGP